MSNDGNIDTISRSPPAKPHGCIFIFMGCISVFTGANSKRGVHFFTISIIAMGFPL